MKNDLLLRTLRGEKVERPPVWMMRQAGRYLPDYMKLKKKYSFFERCQIPELATEITLQPIDQIGVDAAIIFSDILVIPQAMNLEVQLIDGKGPYLPNPIRNLGDISRLAVPDVASELQYVFDALKLTKNELNGRVPLIGFAGAPWTILCYMVQGEGSKNFAKAKSFCFQEPAAAHQLLNMITETTILYLKHQIAAGADAIQLFDSWSGLLGYGDFMKFSYPYCQRIIQAVNGEVLTILFAKGSWYALKEMSDSGAHGLGLDWLISPDFARSNVGEDIVLQGNLDPAKLLMPRKQLIIEVENMLKAFGSQSYIANLGHGILPNVSPDNARAFVETVKQYDFSKSNNAQWNYKEETEY